MQLHRYSLKLGKIVIEQEIDYVQISILPVMGCPEYIWIQLTWLSVLPFENCSANSTTR
jgi:hypothetical protein